MLNELTQSEKNYKPKEEIETPYMRAKKEWDQRIGTSLVQARNWRMAFFASSALVALLLYGFVNLSLQRKVIPVLVHVKGSGEATFGGALQSEAYEPKEREMKFFLWEVIQNLRTVPYDRVIFRRNWEKAYAFLTSSAASINNELSNKENGALEMVGEKTVLTELISINRIGETGSFQVRWTETVFSETGKALDNYIMNGVFSTEIIEPETEEEVRGNPLGIYINNFQWSRENREGVK